MRKFPRAFYDRNRWLAFAVIMVVALLVIGLAGGDDVSANHPVLVEGNCDSPVPGATTVAAGT